MNKKKIKELLAIAERSGEWSIYLMGFSPQEALILKAIADTPKTADEVVRKIIQSPRSVKSAINLLLNHKILTKPDPKRYAVANAKFAAYLATNKIELDKEEVAIVVHDAVYRAVEPLFMGLDEAKSISVSGSFLSDVIAGMASNIVRDKWRLR